MFEAIICSMCYSQHYSQHDRMMHKLVTNAMTRRRWFQMRPLVLPRRQRRIHQHVCRCVAHPVFDWGREVLFLGTENESFIDAKYDRTTTFIDTFLEDQCYSPRINYEKPVFIAICPEEILVALHRGRTPTSTLRVAWLDERCRHKGSRIGNGPVTTTEFHSKMSSQVSFRLRIP